MRMAIYAVLFFVAAVIAGGVVYSVRASYGPNTQPAEVPQMLAKKSRVASAEEAGFKLSRSGYDVTPLSKLKVDELAKKLTPEEAAVMLAKGTELAFCGTLLDNHKDGVYVCKLCGLPLFDSKSKFDSGTGWPSFFSPFDPDHIRYIKDATYGMSRVEILCARSGAHLGHVFDDGPKPTGMRYCLNSASLEFIERKADGTIEWPEASKPVKLETAYFAGGCFWGVEHQLQEVAGVADVVSGYMGGTTKNPTYNDVCTGTTNHAETVMVRFDPTRVPYETLLKAFFRIHDPTQLNRQGPDSGTQYRSAIFTTTPEQAETVKKFVEAQAKRKRFVGRTIVTQIETAEKAGAFYAAEEYHQDYNERSGHACWLPRDIDEEDTLEGPKGQGDKGTK